MEARLPLLSVAFLVLAAGVFFWVRSLPADPSSLEARFRPGETVREPSLRNSEFEFPLETIDLALQDLMRKLEKPFEKRDAAGLCRNLTAGFRGSFLESILPEGTQRRESESGPSEIWTDGKEAFARALEGYFSNFRTIYESHFKVKEYFEGEVHPSRVNARVKQDIRGIRTNGSVHQEFVSWKCSFRKTGGDWLVDRAFVLSRHQMIAPGPLFSEVTSSAGLFATEPPELAINGMSNLSSEGFVSNYDYGGVCLYDVDGDGDLDIYMPNAYGPSALYMNQGDGIFVDEAKERGVEAGGGARGAVFGDVDNDGDPDLFVCRAEFHHINVPNRGNLFFENLGGGRFRERTEASGLTLVAPCMTPVLLDYDRDGFLDLFVTIYGNKFVHHPFNATDGWRNRLYHNNRDGTFSEVSERAGMNETYWSYAVAVCDWNDDLYPDIYVANDYGPNQFYVNRGNGTFDEQARNLGIEDVGNGMGATFVDYNRDRIWDIYVTNMQSSTGQRILRAAGSIAGKEDRRYLMKLTMGNSLFEGRTGGRFVSRGRELGIASTGWAWNGDFADFDADADPDLLVLNGYFSGLGEKDC